jgi:dTDP-4-amino-4,6-dideoxygalactose transaminase
MLNSEFSPWPCFTVEEVDAVAQVLGSNRVNYWTGQECREFEKEFAAWVGCAHAVALANGSLALDSALRVLGIGPGDEVIVTPRTFLASVSCIVLAGARPIFADVDRDSQNITAESIEAVLTPRTKAVICVHLAGWPCDMDPIMTLATSRGLYVIEDCAQAHGALYKGRSVGSIGDVAAWSFCQDKIITTGGEGGMLTTQRKDLWSAAWAYKDHGKSWDAIYEREHAAGFRWVHDSFGTNLRMLEMQAVIGRMQLRRMPDWHAQRKHNAERINDTAEKISALRVPRSTEDYEHAWYKCYVFVRPEQLREGWSRDRVIDEMIQSGVSCFSGSCSEVYLEKAFDMTDFRPKKRLPAARELGETSLMFLVHPTLSDVEINKTCDVLSEVMRRAAR